MKKLKIFGGFALVLCLVVFSAFFAGCKPKLISIHIDETSIQTTIGQGEEFNTDKLIVIAKYKNGEEEIVDNSKLEIISISTQNVGPQIFTVKYKGKEDNITINVEKVLTSIEYDGGKVCNAILNAESDFSAGDHVLQYSYIDRDTVSIKLKYSDGTYETKTGLNDGLEFIGETQFNNTQSNSFKIRFAGKEVEVPFIVDQLNIETQDFPTTVRLGESKLDLTDTTIKLVWNDTNNTTKSYSFEEFKEINGKVGSLDDNNNPSQDGDAEIDATEIGVQNGYIKINDTIKIFEIEVIDISSITYSEGITNSIYRYQNLDTNNVVILLNYDDGKAPVTWSFSQGGITFGDFDSTTKGQKILEIFYKGKTTTKDIEVIDIKNLIVSGINSTVDKGEALDITGAKIKFEYDDSTFSKEYTYSEFLEIGGTISSPDTSIQGSKQLEISIGEGENKKATLFDYTVIFDVESIEYVSGLNEKAYLYQSLDTTNIIVKLIYTDNTYVEVNSSQTSEISFEGIDTTTSGLKSLVIKYKSFQDTVNYTVIGIDTLEISGISDKAYLEKDLDLTNAKIRIKYLDETYSSQYSISEFEEIGGIKENEIDTTSVGAKNLTFSYHGIEGNHSYTVYGRQSISYVDGLADMYRYETPNLNNVKIELVWGDGTKEYVLYTTGDIALNTIDTTVAGQNKSVEISYKGLSTTTTYNVIDIKNLILKNVDEVVYLDKELDLTNASLTLKYADDRERDLTSEEFDKDVTLGSVDTSSAGEKTLAISYKDINDEFNYTVYGISNISYVSGLAENIYYNDTIDTANFVIKVKYTDNFEENVGPGDENIIVTDYDTTTLGAKNLKISYKGKEISVSYTVLDKAVSIAFVTTTVPTAVEKNSTPDFSGVKITVSYLSGKQVEVGVSEFTILPFSTETAGETPFRVKYGDLDEIQTTILVQDYLIMGFELPEFVATFNINSTKKNTFTTTGSTGNQGFEIIGDQYLVGSDNEFLFLPKLTIIRDGELSETIIEEYETTIKVYLQNESSIFEEISAENLSQYVTIDNQKQTYKFTTEAEGKTFKIDVIPSYIPEGCDLIEHIEFTFKVVNGYNVYSAKDLSVFDNKNLNGKWTEYKNANDISLDLKVNAIILQNDILVTKDDLPAIHFYTESEVAGATDADRAVGSLKDSTEGELGYIYYRTLGANENFNFYGNYYMLSAENLPLIVREQGEISESADETLTTHTSLFATIKASGNTSIGNVTFNNINLMGNSKKSENVAKSGGVICFKSQELNFTLDNCLSQGWFINTFFQDSPTSTNIIKNSNIFDANNTLLYVYGATNVQIIDSHLIGAGGPVMICDHIRTGKSNEVVTNVSTTNSVLESFVGGTENWFNAYTGASALASSIKAMDNFMTPYGKTILNSDKFNLISVYKSGEAEGITAIPIEGTFKDSEHEYGLDVGSTSVSNIKTEVQTTLASSGMSQEEIANALASSAILQTTNNAFGVPGTSGWLVSPDSTLMATATDYIHVYLFNGMGAVLGLMNHTA